MITNPNFETSNFEWTFNNIKNRKDHFGPNLGHKFFFRLQLY